MILHFYANRKRHCCWLLSGIILLGKMEHTEMRGNPTSIFSNVSKIIPYLTTAKDRILVYPLRMKMDNLASGYSTADTTICRWPVTYHEL